MLPHVYQVYMIVHGKFNCQPSNIQCHSAVTHTGPYVQAVTIRHPTLDVIWQSQNLSLASSVMASTGTVHVSLSLEESPLAAVHTASEYAFTTCLYIKYVVLYAVIF